MLLQRQHREEMLAHLRGGLPNEACGILAGEQGRTVKVYTATNVAEDRRTRYVMDSLEQLKVMREIEDRGWDMLAIYHSHPFTQAYPSPTDVSLAGYPETVYVIVSLADEQNPVVRAFRIEEGNIVEEPIEVTDE